MAPNVSYSLPPNDPVEHGAEHGGESEGGGGDGEGEGGAGEGGLRLTIGNASAHNNSTSTPQLTGGSRRGVRPQSAPSSHSHASTDQIVSVTNALPQRNRHRSAGASRPAGGTATTQPTQPAGSRNGYDAGNGGAGVGDNAGAGWVSTWELELQVT